MRSMRKLAIASLVYLLPLGIYWESVHADLRCQLRLAPRKLNQLERKLAEVRSVLEGREAFDTELERLKLEIDKLEQILPAQMSPSASAQRLTDAVQGMDIGVEVTAGQVRLEEAYSVLPLRIDFIGHWEAVTGLLARCESYAAEQEKRPDPVDLDEERARDAFGDDPFVEWISEEPQPEIDLLPSRVVQSAGLMVRKREDDLYEGVLIVEVYFSVARQKSPLSVGTNLKERITNRLRRRPQEAKT